MIRTKAQNFLLTVFVLLLPCSSSLTTFGQDTSTDYLRVANELLQTARAGRAQADVICQEPGVCSPDFLTRLGQLQSDLDQLEDLLRPPVRAAEIPALIERIAPAVQFICSQLGVCTPPALGVAASFAEKEPDEARMLGVSCYRCDALHEACARAVADQERRCNQYYTDLLACWQRVPFCDESAPWVLDRELFYSQCTTRFINPGLIPRCRCQCSWVEHQGGCPDFFQTGVVCSGCSFRPCAEIPASCSCARGSEDVPKMQWNYTQCDVCRWASLGSATINLSKTLFCQKPVAEGFQQCFQQRQQCGRSCIWK